MTTAPVGCLDGEQAIRDALARSPTPGPWKVVTREHAHHLGGTHIEANIFCTWDHPQLKGAMAVVATSTGIGPEPGSRPVQFAYIRPADAALIAACNPETMRALLAEFDRLRSALSVHEGIEASEEWPTKEMVEAGLRRMFADKQYAAPWEDVICNMFRAMLAAAPQQAQEAQGDRHGE